mmetsp:Transcript_3079/g.9143  ORF Transcript_3079/g.9143 Transcript_3079/m.9143 type:complete len:223 (+) Transcript_3079:985-1653(+)
MCFAVMLIRCVRRADVPCAYAHFRLNSIRCSTSAADQNAASAAVERSAPDRDPSVLVDRSAVWPLSMCVCRSTNVGSANASSQSTLRGSRGGNNRARNEGTTARNGDRAHPPGPIRAAARSIATMRPSRTCTSTSTVPSSHFADSGGGAAAVDSNSFPSDSFPSASRQQVGTETLQSTYSDLRAVTARTRPSTHRIHNPERHMAPARRHSAQARKRVDGVPG